MCRCKYRLEKAWVETVNESPPIFTNVDYLNLSTIMLSFNDKNNNKYVGILGNKVWKDDWL